MGLIRLLLALAVVLFHAGYIFGFTYLDGLMAVQSFFIISGFYMSLILNEKYTGKNSYTLFISNRLLRLFPAYILIIALTFIMICVFSRIGIPSEVNTNYSGKSFLSKFYVFFINLFLLGQDTSLFLGFDSNGVLHYAADFYKSSPPVYKYLLCPQAWSISIELLFYSIAPFIVRRKLQIIIVVMSLSFVLRLVLYSKGFYRDPWTYRFFPTELFFFLLGNIGYRIYTCIRERESARKAGLIMLITLVVFALVFNYLPGTYYIKQYAFYLFLAASVPFIFNYTRNFSSDRFIGELSYPVYLSHMLVLWFFLPLLNRAFNFPNSLSGILTVIITLLFSYAIQVLVEKRMDKFRAKRLERHNAV
ncbi:MAG TPA: acyltransferase [Bacteroidia bacterium]|jgi:peptidoglycan/LPS O-acetylase OafA/YrhL|nr:acyltransferase [Bacteroidia bacterium]